MLAPSKKLSRDETRPHNQLLALNLIYNHGEISRADIARAAGLTRTTASSAVAELIAEGLVEELGQGPSLGGKPPTLLRVVDDARQIVGVDLAGFEAQAALFDLRGRILHRACSKVTPARSGQAALDSVYEMIDGPVHRATKPLLGIGVGVPGLLDTQTGVIHQAVNLDWYDLPLGQLLQARYDLPVYLVSDSQAAALGQHTFGADKDVSHLAVLLVGHGISAGIIADGKLYFGGVNSGASEVGHVRVVENGELCACGHVGCLETVASQGALLRWAKTIFRSQPESKLHQVVTDADAITLDHVLWAYQAGDLALAAAVAQLGRYLGGAVANLAAVLNVPLVVLAGSMTRLGEPWLQAVSAEMRQRMLATLAEATTVKISELGDDIVMLGAAALLLANEMGVTLNWM